MGCFQSKIYEEDVELDEKGVQTEMKLTEEQSSEIKPFSLDDFLSDNTTQTTSTTSSKRTQTEQHFKIEKGILLSLGENPREKQKYRREGFSDYQIEALFRHNFYRSFHPNTPQLKLCQKLCNEAQSGANDLSKMNKFDHITETHGAGESLFSSTGEKG
ncbi:unnamed protein product [Oikopleura dioica]|uniref:Uncharacterized protein n=1 Tax=Oikopleura dioica TaxID=34765 RepID=E4X4G8_OIKDI|nr:unnamed protein product [Oikopleura dioica]